MIDGYALQSMFPHFLSGADASAGGAGRANEEASLSGESSGFGRMLDAMLAAGTGSLQVSMNLPVRKAESLQLEEVDPPPSFDVLPTDAQMALLQGGVMRETFPVAAFGQELETTINLTAPLTEEMRSPLAALMRRIARLAEDFFVEEGGVASSDAAALASVYIDRAEGMAPTSVEGLPLDAMQRLTGSFQAVDPDLVDDEQARAFETDWLDLMEDARRLEFLPASQNWLGDALISLLRKARIVGGIKSNGNVKAGGDVAF